MKKIYATVFVALLFDGCEKAQDYIKINPCAEMNLCTIKSISYTGMFGEEDSLVFTYNAVGNPVSITRRIAGSGMPNYAFKYDKKGRLTDFYAPYEARTAAEYWHKYFYDNKGRITIDSFYTLCDIKDDSLVSHHSGSRYVLQYDVQNRIILDSLEPPGIYYSTALHYTYDANGNREGRTYDQKVHFRRTNKIWMFIDRDYSMNNAFTADAYNLYGLPTTFDLSTKGGELNFLRNYLTSGKIVYTCR